MNPITQLTHTTTTNTQAQQKLWVLNNIIHIKGQTGTHMLRTHSFPAMLVGRPQIKPRLNLGPLHTTF
jgi:hypothetical protein